MLQKTTFFLSVFLTISVLSNAQFKRGDRMVGATVASVVFNSGNSDISVTQVGTNTSKMTNYNVSISPSLGWFISENTAVGATVNINPASNKVSYEQNGSTFQKDKSNSFNIGLGGFVRHYMGSSISLKPFVQTSVNLGMSNFETDGFYYYATSSPYYKYTYSGKSSGGFFANATISGGFTKMMGENAGLDFYIGYAYSYSKNTFNRTTLYYLTNTSSPSSTASNETTTKFTNNGFLLGVGFQVFLKGKRK
ncbi:MAG: hypothetical protein AAB221_03545 [Bacteroidota bacterium]